MLKKGFLVLMVVVIAMMPALASAHAESYGPTFFGSLTVKGASCHPESTCCCYGKGFKPGTTCTVCWDGRKVCQAKASSSGKVSFSLTIPSKTKEGYHTISCTGERKKCGTLVLLKTIYVRSKCSSKHSGASSIVDPTSTHGSVTHQISTIWGQVVETVSEWL
ncbi:MAG TPA: hypothetical protein VGK02_05440 [Candidatus Aquicultor sp.]|jgi:hypothetical protein